MDQETLFTSSKWDILKVLSSGQKSPLELARETKTSIANISQQLRMLELANIVKSERVGNRERGEPRLLYSLSGPLSFLISTSPNFVNKKQLRLSVYHEIILRIWFIQDQSVHYYLEKFFWEIEQKLDKIDAIYVKSDITRLTVIIITKDQELKKTIKGRDIKKSAHESMRLEVSVLSEEQFASEHTKGGLSQTDLNVIYDPSFIFDRINEKSEVKA